MSVLLHINYAPNSIYNNEAEKYIILNAKNEIICTMTNMLMWKVYQTYELKEGEKLMCLFTEEISLNKYLQYIQYKPKTFFEEITNDKVVLDESEKSVFDEFKSYILKGFIRSYIDNLESIKTEDLKFIHFKLNRYNLKVSDLEPINDNIYKFKRSILTQLESDLNTDVLQNLELKSDQLNRTYLYYWEHMINEDINKTVKPFKLGFMHTYDRIKNGIENKEQSIQSDDSPYRFINNTLVKIKNYSEKPFMNLKDSLSIKLNSDGVYEIYCISEVI
jgi:hypothetical protein